MKQHWQLELAEARVLIEAATARAKEIGVPETVAVVDDGGHLIALERMDGARITGPEIAIAKAFTAAGHRRSTHLFNTPPNGPALPNNEAYGIQLMFPGKFAVFVGGFPIVVDGQVVGGLGVSGGNGEQDTQVGAAALAGLAHYLEGTGHRVLTETNIKL
ncbi:GlcG/HbpS family heme-binding protein [Kyrpidia spormannii]|uniref:CDP-alcohol phosphatidyltransferase n=2 Tax=Kyrpidia spormannii TaxID=2055160 RepID=A0ACA8Z4T4_9BACL|nr:heme-binding protein [Kyrpidia spormannii]CAB3389448.1 CDP-alcohol phosphatidyltransferase [Kyrpidia spormannii]CAB3390180.1 CDP-alcohol phosphatidyltransferase [Kyrpidia spormannii]